MARRLPPLNALRAFEAAARHLSFAKAAEELNVTPGAISHQVKALEVHLGVTLFHRRNRTIGLTRSAEGCLPNLRAGFDSLAEAVERVLAQEKIAALAIGAAPSLAARWLTPRLHHFVAAHPDIDVRISASTSLIDVRDDGSSSGREMIANPTADTDVTIRFGTGVYPGFRAEKLLSVAVTAMCSPRLLDGEHPLHSPSDLRHHALLKDDAVYFAEETPDWDVWLQAAGAGDIDTSRGVRFSHSTLALEAAADGLGVVLGNPMLAAQELAGGRLVVPFATCLPSTFAYYVVCEEANCDRPDIFAFRDWLRAEAESSQVCAARGNNASCALSDASV